VTVGQMPRGAAPQSGNSHRQRVFAAQGMSTTWGTDLDTSALLWIVLFSSVGLAFFVYGRKQRAVVPLLCGFALMIYPYFVSNTIILVLIGTVLVAIPCFVKI
jgi:hypothetical protein